MTPQQSPPVRVELRSDRKIPPLVEDVVRGILTEFVRARS